MSRGMEFLNSKIKPMGWPAKKKLEIVFRSVIIYCPFHFLNKNRSNIDNLQSERKLATVAFQWRKKGKGWYVLYDVLLHYFLSHYFQHSKCKIVRTKHSLQHFLAAVWKLCSCLQYNIVASILFVDFCNDGMFQDR